VNYDIVTKIVILGKLMKVRLCRVAGIRMNYQRK